MILQAILAVLPDISLMHTIIALKSHQVWLEAFPQTIRLLAYESLSLGVPGCPFPTQSEGSCPALVSNHRTFWAFSHRETCRESSFALFFFYWGTQVHYLNHSETDGDMEWDIFPKSNPPEPNLAIPPAVRRLPYKLTCLDFIFPKFSMKMRTKSARMLAEALFFPELQEKKKKKAGQSNSLRSAKNDVSASFLRLYLRQIEFWGSGNCMCFDAALAGP